MREHGYSLNFNNWRKQKKMKILTAGIALALLTTVAHAEDKLFETTIGAERNTETEINSIYSSVDFGQLELGVTMEDTVADNAKFNATKYEVDFTQPITDTVTMYIKNDFDEDMKHDSTVIGGKVTF